MHFKILFAALIALASTAPAAPLPFDARSIVRHDQVSSSNNIEYRGASIGTFGKRGCAIQTGANVAATSIDLNPYGGYEQQIMLEGPHFVPEPAPRQRILIISRPNMDMFSSLSGFLPFKIPSFSSFGTTMPPKPEDGPFKKSISIRL
ncbi:hypothetical protein FRB94_007088 [Tulasnella sp. JGI-2019a]|nr:hypothetical protein FRB94_007088 [Tulasnella sp. JGI-2019a]KAG9016999.1 hypothetical protein FRB93_009529 [Tulasnella sp. JGI-2019a]KAG9040103.1 hypothetical protein FRB95_000032 [Tulasnella sp. JGI-2019a]